MAILAKHLDELAHYWALATSEFARLLERLLAACEQMQKGGWWLCFGVELRLHGRSWMTISL